MKKLALRIIKFVLGLGNMFLAALTSKLIYLWILLAIFPSLPILPFVAFIGLNLVFIYLTCQPAVLAAAGMYLMDKMDIKGETFGFVAIYISFIWNIAIMFTAFIIGLFL